MRIGRNENIRSSANSEGGGKSFAFIVPILSLLVILGFSLYPFFFDFEAKRVRFENISYIGYLVKKEIFSKLKEDDGGGENMKSVKKMLPVIYSLCDESLWTRSCRVDFSYPDVIKVKFDEVRPIAFLLEGDKVFLVSDRGEKLTKPFSFAEVYELGLDRFSLPFVVMESKSCSLHEIVDFVKYMKDMKGDFADQIVCFDFSVEIYSKSGYKVILPREDIKTAFLRFMKFEQDISSDDDVREVDVRGGEKIYVR